MIDIRSVKIWFSQKGGRLKLDVRCPVCQVKAEVTQTVQDEGGLIYTLDCPKCGRNLATYHSGEELPAGSTKGVQKWRM